MAASVSGIRSAINGELRAGRAVHRGPRAGCLGGEWHPAFHLPAATRVMIASLKFPRPVARRAWAFLRKGLASLGLLSSAALAAAPLSPQETRTSPFDLAIGGELVGLPARATRYLPWKALRALPTQTLTLSGEFVKGEQQVTVVFLQDLWAALPVAPGTDAILATCSDGYTSIYRSTFIATYRPFLILEINGRGPETWPPEGLKFNPGPYVISISDTVAPAVSTLLDSGHKRPWGVARIDIANYAQRNAPAYTGKWAHLSGRAQEGREIWVNSCASCHRGPPSLFGGTKSDRPFEVLAAHAAYNQDYFKRYVRNPQAVMPGAKMEAHPHYSDMQLDALIAFIVAEPAT